MKILFVTKGDLPDYQADTIMHGGRSVLGEDFVDMNFSWYMYKKEKEEFWNTRVPDGGRSYGRGMTLHGTLPECNVDRTDIEAKLRNKFFDYVIYGSATRLSSTVNGMENNYPQEKIIYVDGEDGQNVQGHFTHNGILFKRELNGVFRNTFPISFGIPKEKIINSVPKKTQDWGTVIPGRMETYIFQDEKSYYEDYQKSFFALTHKKGGWDCLRHYEILANGCVPFFLDIEGCPDTTMVDFPKELCKEARTILASGIVDEGVYYNLADKMLKWTKDKLTTEVVFTKLLNTIK